MSNELAATGKRSLVVELASANGMEPAPYYQAIKELCGCKGARDAHFSGLMMVARKLDLNPILKQIVLVDNRGKVSISVPVDGWLTIMTRHPDYVSHEVEFFWSDDPYASDLLAACITIYRRSVMAAGLPPFKHEERFAECYMPPKNKRDGGTFDGPWQSHPMRMLRWKAVNQGVRECFGIYVPDEDEIESRNRYGDDAVASEPCEMKPVVPLDALEPVGEEGGGSPGQDDADPSSGQPAPVVEPEAAPADFDAQESARIDAEIAQGDMFDG